MSLNEDRLRRMGEGAHRVPAVGGVISRGRQIRRRRRGMWIGSIAVAVIAGGAVAAPDLVARTSQVIAGGRTLTAVPDEANCQVVGRAAPTAADGLRMLPDAATIPPGLHLDIAHAAEGIVCPKAPAPLVLVRYEPDRRTVERTFTVWGPGADSFALGSSTGTIRVRGYSVTVYGEPDSPFQAFMWTEAGMRWRAEGQGMRRDEITEMVQALRIDPALATVDLPADLTAGYTKVASVPAFPGADREPGWTVVYDGSRPDVGQVTISVNHNHDSFDALLAPGMRITTVRGHRAAYRSESRPSSHSASLMWEERPGVLVRVQAENFPGPTPDLLRIATSLRPLSDTDPRITD